MIKPLDIKAPQPSRLEFLWNQHAYISDYIKFADAKAALIASGTTAIIGAAFGARFKPAAILALRAPTSLRSCILLVSFLALALSVLLSAWCIKPRLLTGKTLAPMSWVDISNYQNAQAFEKAHYCLKPDELGPMLARQIFYMSKICRRKHRLVALSLWSCIVGAVLMVLQAISV